MPEALTPWTPTRIEALVDLWCVHHQSASVIASRLGGTSRNAVIGKLKRLGKLGGRRKPARQKPVGRPRARSLIRAKLAERPHLIRHEPVRRARSVAAIAVPEPASLGLGVLELQADACRWPHGEPGKAGFGFCGHPIRHGSYCAHHAWRAWQAPF